MQLGNEKADAKASGDKGRWEVTFPAREASAEPQTMVVTTGNWFGGLAIEDCALRSRAEWSRLAALD